MPKKIASAPSGEKKGNRGVRFFKRACDIVFSLLLIVVLSPFLLILSVIAAVDTKGHPLFVQERMGRRGVPFYIYKFRTMSVKAPADVATHKLERPEQYISPVGEFLRRTSLDELPQLFNVLKGDMSFVGPRPVVLTETDLLTLRCENGADEVRPGITGLAQVSGRDTVTVSQKAQLDKEYAEHLSVKNDIAILAKTAAQVAKSEDVVEGANEKISDCAAAEERNG